MGKKLGVALGIFALAAGLVGTATAATTQEKCASSRRKAAGKKISSKMGCVSKAKAKGLPLSDPSVTACNAKAEAKFTSAYNKPTGCAGGQPSAAMVEALVDSCVATLTADTPGNGKCPSGAAKAAGKAAGANLSCSAKAIAKPATFTACEQKSDDKLTSALAKAVAATPTCTPSGTLQADVDTCQTSIDSQVTNTTSTSTTSSTSTSTSSTSTSTSSTSTSTSSTSTTTSTAPGLCCDKTILSFTTSSVFGATTGSVLDDSANPIESLVAGGLYFGGGLDGITLPAKIPGQGNTLTAITSCNSVSGALTLGPKTAAQTGSNRNCSNTGCLFGAPLPIPNVTTPAVSTCVVNVVSAPASGTADCSNGTVAGLSLPLNSGIYLTGDLVPSVTGIQPCPICTGGTCKGGPNNGLACTPGTDTSGDAYPTSDDCPPPVANFLGNLPIGFNLTTGTQTDTATDNSPTQTNIFCGFCANGGGVFENAPRSCSTNVDCTNISFTKCRQRSAGAFGTDAASLGTARTLSETGSPVPGSYTLNDGAPHASTLVSLFCIPPTYNGLVDGSADLPGPGAVALPGATKLQ